MPVITGPGYYKTGHGKVEVFKKIGDWWYGIILEAKPFPASVSWRDNGVARYAFAESPYNITGPWIEQPELTDAELVGEGFIRLDKDDVIRESDEHAYLKHLKDDGCHKGYFIKSRCFAGKRPSEIQVPKDLFEGEEIATFIRSIRR